MLKAFGDNIEHRRPDRFRRLLNVVPMRVNQSHRGGCTENHSSGARNEQALGVGCALIDCQQQIVAFDRWTHVNSRPHPRSSNAACSIPLAVRVKCARRNSAVPVGANVSGTPRMRIGAG